LSATAAVVSDYDFRGITQSRQEPAFQGSVDWSSESSGFYASAWASTIDFGYGYYCDPNLQEGDPGEPADAFYCTDEVDGAEGGRRVRLDQPKVELDLVLGYAGEITDNWGYDVGGVWYTYLGGDDLNADIDYGEIYAGLNFRAIAAKVWYSPDYGNANESAWYAELNGDASLPWGLTALLHAGYSGGQYWSSDDIGLDEYLDWSVGLARSFGPLEVTLKWIDGSDLEEAEDVPRIDEILLREDTFTSDAKVFLSLATSFPWSDE
jgi:uncharacterized protein (TIGR02001 family)